MAILIDSSVWIDWLRNSVDPRPLLKPWIYRGDCLICGIVKLEVLRGIIHAAQRDKVSRFFELLQEIELDRELCDAAAERAWKLDREGKVLGISDLLIAECAIQKRAWLVTLDKDFDVIKGLKTRKALPRLR